MNGRLCTYALALTALVSGVVVAETGRVELPGFSIVVPAGKVTAHSDQQLAGSYRVQPSISEKLTAPYDVLDPGRLHPAHREIAVSWIDQGYSHEEWLNMFVKPTALTVPNATVLHDEDLGTGKFLAAIGNDQLPIGMALAPCGDHLSVFVVFALSLELSEQLRGARLAIDSIACSPSAAAPPLEPAVALPAGFVRGQGEESNSYSNAEGEVVLFSYTSGSIQGREEPFRKLFGTMLGSALQLEPGSVNLVPSTPLADGTPVHRMSGGGEFDGSFVAARDCADHQLTLIVIWAGHKPSAALAAKRLAAVSCPAPVKKSAVSR